MLAIARWLGLILPLAGNVSAAAAQQGAAHPPEASRLKLRSSGFSDGAMLPQQFTRYAAVAAGAQTPAHHSVAATYLEGQSVTIEGQLVQFLLRNPHSFVHVMVKQSDGSMMRYVMRLISFRRPKDGLSWGLLPNEKVD